MGLVFGFITLAQSYGLKGYLCLDDVVTEKRFSNWCAGPVKIPVAFRLWQPQEKCGPRRYRIKIQLAQQMIVEMLTLALAFAYLTFDCWFNARWFTKFLNGCGIIWVSTLKKNTYVI